MEGAAFSFIVNTRNHIGSLHPPQQTTNEISFLLLEGEAVKHMGLFGRI